MNHRFLILIAVSLTASVNLFAQGERKDKTAVTYEELYDEPYSVNKLFVGIQPLYAEMFVTNVNNLPMEVHLIPRDRYESTERAARQGEFRGDCRGRSRQVGYQT